MMDLLTIHGTESGYNGIPLPDIYDIYGVEWCVAGQSVNSWSKSQHFSFPRPHLLNHLSNKLVLDDCNRREDLLKEIVDDSMARANIAPDPLHWWNPRKIILQIILIQLLYTIIATLLMTFIVLVMGAPFRIDYVFLYSRFRRDNVFGWSLSFLSNITAGLMCVPLFALLDLG